MQGRHEAIWTTKGKRRRKKIIKKVKERGPSFTVENAKSLDGSEDLGEQTYGDKKFATFMWKGKFYAYYNSDGNAGCIAIDGSNIQPDNEAIQKVLSSIKIK